jgi:hypothetical protein
VRWVYRVEFRREYILIWVSIFSTNLRYMSYMQMDQICKGSKSNSFAFFYSRPHHLNGWVLSSLPRLMCHSFRNINKYNLKVSLELISFVTSPWKAFE